MSHLLPILLHRAAPGRRLVDRGDGKGFVTLTLDSTPDYLGTMPFPAAAAKWTYKAIYRLEDQRVGLWSDEANITVAV